jgi:oligopeptide transport system ATP-binding protein
MKRLKKELGMAIALITHDLGVVAEMAQRVAVMYAGKIVEEADVLTLFRKPLHPYTEGLLKSIPRIDGDKGRLHVIEGVVPNPLRLPSGCRFNPRCPYAMDICREKSPEFIQVGPTQHVSCWLRTSTASREVAS